MTYLLAGLILSAALVAGGRARQQQDAISRAVIYYGDGTIQQVAVRNTGDRFCPPECKVRHRHRVHDIRWTCAEGNVCGHFIVLQVFIDQDNRSLTPLVGPAGRGIPAEQGSRRGIPQEVTAATSKKSSPTP